MALSSSFHPTLQPLHHHTSRFPPPPSSSSPSFFCSPPPHRIPSPHGVGSLPFSNIRSLTSFPYSSFIHGIIKHFNHQPVGEGTSVIHAMPVTSGFHDNDLRARGNLLGQGMQGMQRADRRQVHAMAAKNAQKMSFYLEDETEVDEAMGDIMDMGEWIRNRPVGFGHGKEYDLSLEENLLADIEADRKAREASKKGSGNGDKGRMSPTLSTASGVESIVAENEEEAISKQSWRNKTAKDTNVMIVGATGYIGKFVVKEMVKRGYNVIAVAREKSGIGGKASMEQTTADFPGATVLFADVTNMDSITSALQSKGTNVDVVISCLASRNGGKQDSWKIDYQATRNSLDAGVARGASHFVLLSAICVQKPLLEFQKAKLKLEVELESYGKGLTYSIVRPTAFFKSLGGQVQSVQGGGPYVMFGDGQLCACKPISEADLASFIADCVSELEKVNQVLPIGGPGKALTPLEQGEMLFRIVGKEPKFIKVPIGIMDFVIGVLDNLAKLFPNLADAAEFGKIGRYYAAESMLVLDPTTGKYDADATPSYGTDTLDAFFDRCVREGMAGQELGDQAVF